MTPEDQMDELEPEEEENATIKQLRDAAKRGEKASARNATLEKENAFLKAGINTDTDLGKLMLTGYDGELTPDAIKAWAERIQPAGTNTTGNPEVTEDEKKFTDTRSELASGQSDGAGVPQSSDYVADGYEAFWQAQRDGKPRDVAAAEVLDRIIDAAGKGDPRALVPPGRQGTSG